MFFNHNHTKLATIGGVSIGTSIFISMCSLVIVLENRDDNDKYIQVGDIYTQCYENYHRRQKGEKLLFSGKSMKYSDSRRFQLTPVLNRNVISRKEFKMVKDAQKQAHKEERNKPDIDGRCLMDDADSRMTPTMRSNNIRRLLSNRSSISTPATLYGDQMIRTKNWVKGVY